MRVTEVWGMPAEQAAFTGPQVPGWPQDGIVSRILTAHDGRVKSQPGKSERGRVEPDPAEGYTTKLVP